MSNKTKIKRKFTAGRPSIESLSNGEMCLVVPDNVVYVKKDFENLLAITTGGTQCIIVSSFGTPQENGLELQKAYNDAKNRTPSAANPITIVATPGTYKFPYAGFIMDTPYINLVSLDGNRSLIFDIELNDQYGAIDPYTNNQDGSHITSPCLTILSDNIFLKGVEGQTVPSPQYENEIGGLYVLPIDVLGSFPNLVIEKCKGGLFSFGGHSDVNTSFISESAGIFIDCVGGISSFGSISLGTYINCVAGRDSFGTYAASGNYVNCVGGDYSFNAFNVTSGSFENCTGGLYSFGGAPGYGDLSGRLLFCRLTTGTFIVVTGGGKIIYCVDGFNNTNNQ